MYIHHANKNPSMYICNGSLRGIVAPLHSKQEDILLLLFYIIYTRSIWSINCEKKSRLRVTLFYSRGVRVLERRNRWTFVTLFFSRKKKEEQTGGSREEKPNE